MKHNHKASPLDDFQMQYEDMPLHKLIPRKGGKVSKMTKNTSTEPKATKAKYSKTRGEHVKDILIAVLITGVIAFVGGMHFENSRNAEMQNAVSAATLNVKK